MSTNQKFRILSLDGGGIKGAFTASVLASLEKSTNLRIADHFDLITGTSTGGIIALGLGLGISAESIRDFYLESGPKIFSSSSSFSKLGFVKQLLTPKHSQNLLRESLKKVFGDRLLGESSCRLVLPTYDAISGRIYLMKTAHHDRFTHDVNLTAVDVALSISAAPTYFKAATVSAHEGARYVDGGVWANNPVMVGYTEAVAFLKQNPADLEILSIGTTSTPFNIARQRKAGALKWNIGLVQLLFESQTEAAINQVKLLAGRVHRIDAIVGTRRFSLDKADSETINQLVVLGRGEAIKKENLELVKLRFLNGIIASPFVPKRKKVDD